MEPNPQPSIKIVGFVTGIKKSNNTRFILCNLTYPGVECIVWCSKKNSVDIGEWIEATITDPGYIAKYFPASPTPDTPRPEIFIWKKVDAPQGYTVTVDGPVNIKVEIKDFRVPQGMLVDQILGVLDDSRNSIPDGCRVADLVVRLQKVTRISDGRPSCWSVQKAETKIVESGSSQNDTKSLEDLKIKPEPKTSPPPTPVDQKVVQKVDQKAKPPKVEQKKEQKVEKPPVDHQKVEKGELKRVVVTSIKSSGIRSQRGGLQTAFLWMLDDHLPAVMFTTGEVLDQKDGTLTKIYPGYFFEGRFEQNEKGKWQCRKHVKKIGKLMDTVFFKGQLELQFVIDKVWPVSGDRLKPEAYHCFVGKITDQYEELPKECSSGVRINIKFYYITARSEWSWIVSKVHNSSKHVQLLTEFHQAWHAPGVREIISVQCMPDFAKLKNLMDTVPDGIQKASEDWKFAWVMDQEEDFVRIVVFPRDEGQNVDGMKKKVMTNGMVYGKIRLIKLHKLYKVKLAKNGEVIEMVNCPQYFESDEFGNIEFKFISSNDTILTRNVAIVNPIGAPKWLGKLMFFNPNGAISSRKMLMKTKFRLLDDEDLFANGNLASDNGVLFLNTGCAVEKLPNQNLEQVMEAQHFEDEILIYERNLFKTKLQNLHPNLQVFPMFQTVCNVLKNKAVVEQMDAQGINTDELMQLQKGIRSG